jgi:hypothetical protein
MLTPGRASFDNWGDHGRTQNQIAKRTQFDLLFSTKGQNQSQILPGGASRQGNKRRQKATLFNTLSSVSPVVATALGVPRAAQLRAGHELK